MNRSEYEKRKGPPRHDLNEPVEGVEGSIMNVVSCKKEGTDTPHCVAVRIDVEYLNPCVVCTYTAAEDLDRFIDGLISARNYVWPNN